MCDFVKVRKESLNQLLYLPACLCCEIERTFAGAVHSNNVLVT